MNFGNKTSTPVGQPIYPVQVGSVLHQFLERASGESRRCGSRMASISSASSSGTNSNSNHTKSKSAVTRNPTSPQTQAFQRSLRTYQTPPASPPGTPIKGRSPRPASNASAEARKNHSKFKIHSYAQNHEKKMALQNIKPKPIVSKPPIPPRTHNFAPRFTRTETFWDQPSDDEIGNKYGSGKEPVVRLIRRRAIVTNITETSAKSSHLNECRPKPPEMNARKRIDDNQEGKQPRRVSINPVPEILAYDKEEIHDDANEELVPEVIVCGYYKDEMSFEEGINSGSDRPFVCGYKDRLEGLNKSEDNFGSSEDNELTKINLSASNDIPCSNCKHLEELLKDTQNSLEDLESQVQRFKLETDNLRFITKNLDDQLLHYKSKEKETTFPGLPVIPEVTETSSGYVQTDFPNETSITPELLEKLKYPLDNFISVQFPYINDTGDAKDSQTLQKQRIQYMHIALASRDGLLSELRTKLKIGHKILSRRFRALQESQGISLSEGEEKLIINVDVDFVLNSYRRFARFMYNYIDLSLKDVQEFDRINVHQTSGQGDTKSSSYFRKATMTFEDGVPQTGIFIPISSKCDEQSPNNNESNPLTDVPPVSQKSSECSQERLELSNPKKSIHEAIEEIKIPFPEKSENFPDISSAPNISQPVLSPNVPTVSEDFEPTKSSKSDQSLLSKLRSREIFHPDLPSVIVAPSPKPLEIDPETIKKEIKLEEKAPDPPLSSTSRSREIFYPDLSHVVVAPTAKLLKDDTETIKKNVKLEEKALIIDHQQFQSEPAPSSFTLITEFRTDDKDFFEETESVTETDMDNISCPIRGEINYSDEITVEQTLQATKAWIDTHAFTAPVNYPEELDLLSTVPEDEAIIECYANEDLIHFSLSDFEQIPTEARNSKIIETKRFNPSKINLRSNSLTIKTESNGALAAARDWVERNPSPIKTNILDFEKLSQIFACPVPVSPGTESCCRMGQSSARSSVSSGLIEFEMLERQCLIYDQDLNSTANSIHSKLGEIKVSEMDRNLNMKRSSLNQVEPLTSFYSLRNDSDNFVTPKQSGCVPEDSKSPSFLNDTVWADIDTNASPTDPPDTMQWSDDKLTDTLTDWDYNGNIINIFRKKFGISETPSTSSLNLVDSAKCNSEGDNPSRLIAKKPTDLSPDDASPNNLTKIMKTTWNYNRNSDKNIERSENPQPLADQDKISGSDSPAIFKLLKDSEPSLPPIAANNNIPSNDQAQEQGELTVTDNDKKPMLSTFSQGENATSLQNIQNTSSSLIDQDTMLPIPVKNSIVKRLDGGESNVSPDMKKVTAPENPRSKNDNQKDKLHQRSTSTGNRPTRPNDNELFNRFGWKRSSQGTTSESTSCPTTPRKSKLPLPKK